MDFGNHIDHSVCVDIFYNIHFFSRCKKKKISHAVGFSGLSILYIREHKGYKFILIRHVKHYFYYFLFNLTFIAPRRIDQRVRLCSTFSIFFFKKKAWRIRIFNDKKGNLNETNKYIFI